MFNHHFLVYLQGQELPVIVYGGLALSILVHVAYGVKWYFDRKDKRDEDWHKSRTDAEKHAVENLRDYVEMLRDDAKTVRLLLRESEAFREEAENFAALLEKKLKRGWIKAQDLEPTIKIIRNCINFHNLDDTKLFNKLDAMEATLKDLIDCLGFEA